MPPGCLWGTDTEEGDREETYVMVLGETMVHRATVRAAEVARSVLKVRVHKFRYGVCYIKSQGYDSKILAWAIFNVLLRSTEGLRTRS